MKNFLTYLFFRWLPIESQSWWTNFCNDQTFFFPPSNIQLDDFWPTPVLAEPEEPTTLPNDEQQPTIAMPSHPIISTQQLDIDNHIMIKDDNFTEGGRNFRVAKIIALYDNTCDVNLLTLTNNGYYAETDDDITEVDIEVVLTTIELTVKGKIHSSTLYKLARQFNLQFTNN